MRLYTVDQVLQAFPIRRSDLETAFVTGELRMAAWGREGLEVSAGGLADWLGNAKSDGFRRRAATWRK